MGVDYRAQRVGEAVRVSRGEMVKVREVVLRRVAVHLPVEVNAALVLRQGIEITLIIVLQF